MRRGFTILELLVASLLLGMLMTILTMIFNQSSIAWRTGVAGVTNMSEARQVISGVRYKADNAYPDKDGQLMNVKSVFSENGTIVSSREEYITSFGGAPGFNRVEAPGPDGDDVENSCKPVPDCGSGTAKDQSTYVVNVMSKGPDGKEDTYDDIWSFPDDPELWCD